MRRPSNRDLLAPIGRLRRLVREKWPRPGSAQPASPDRAQLALPTAVIDRQSVACMVGPARLALGPADLVPEPARLVPRPAGLDTLTGSGATSPTTKPPTTGKLNFARPIEALRTLRHVRKCSCS